MTNNNNGLLLPYTWLTSCNIDPTTHKEASLSPILVQGNDNLQNEGRVEMGQSSPPLQKSKSFVAIQNIIHQSKENLKSGLEKLHAEQYIALPVTPSMSTLVKEAKANLLNGVELLQTELGATPRMKGGEKKVRRYELVKVGSGFYKDGYRAGKIVARRVRSVD